MNNVDATLARFNSDMDTLLARLDARLSNVTANTVVQVAASLMAKSPVGDPLRWKRHEAPAGYRGGHFRANWQHGFNVTPSGVVKGVDPSGQATLNTIATRVAATQGEHGVHYLVNNVSYANALEYGHSSQAPQGMVGLTVAEFPDIVARAVASAKTGAKETA